MRIGEAFSNATDKARGLGRDAATVAKVAAAVPVVALLALQESTFRSPRIIGFEPLEQGSREDASSPKAGEVFAPYGATAKVVVEFDGQVKEGLLRDVKQKREGKLFRHAAAILIWGKRVVTDEKENVVSHYVEGIEGSVRVEDRTNKGVTVTIKELDGAELTHYRPPREEISPAASEA